MSRVKITSVFTKQTWEGEVDLGDVPNKLEYLFRMFNRVDETDITRLQEIGFEQPSMSEGDLIEIDGETWLCAPLGFEKVQS